MIAMVVTCAWIYTDAQVPENCYVTAGKEKKNTTPYPKKQFGKREGKRKHNKDNP